MKLELNEQEVTFLIQLIKTHAHNLDHISMERLLLKKLSELRGDFPDRPLLA